MMLKLIRLKLRLRLPFFDNEIKLIDVYVYSHKDVSCKREFFWFRFLGRFKVGVTSCF